MPEDAELRNAKKRIKDLEEENAMLKKAMAIFSSDVKYDITSSKNIAPNFALRRCTQL